MPWIILFIVAVLFVIAFMVYKLPSDPVARRQKKAKREEPAPAPQKDWQEIAARWEKKNNALIGDVEKMSAVEKKLQKELDAQKASVKEMMDKMALEKSWREKEQGNLEKAKQHEKELKEQIIRTEKDLEREHSGRLAAERELQELKVKFDQVNEAKRQLSVEAASLSTTVKQLRGQARDLIQQNDELKKKREDVQWVAKSEYDELLRKYKEKGG